MSYQQCPMCFGRGTTYTGLTVDAVCPTCRGLRIIDTVTGLPPNNQILINTSEVVTGMIINPIKPNDNETIR